MSLFGGGPRPVYRVYAEDEYDGEVAQPHRPPVTAGSLEPRRRPMAFLVVGLLVLVAMIVVFLVLSNASRRATHQPASSAPAVSTATPGHSRTHAASPAPLSAPPRRSPVRRPQRARRPSAAARVHTGANASASAGVPVPAALGRPLPEPPATSVEAEFGFEP